MRKTLVFLYKSKMVKRNMRKNVFFFSYYLKEVNSLQ